jgi:hypothetical protein
MCRANGAERPTCGDYDPGSLLLLNREAIMSKAVVFLTAVIFGLSSPALAAGKGGGGGGGGSGQTASSHASAGSSPGTTANKAAVGNATRGAGAGKIKFNEFTIKKTTDQASPK